MSRQLPTWRTRPLLERSLAKVTAEYPNLRYGEDYVNLGYKDGAAMSKMATGYGAPGAAAPNASWMTTL